MDDVDLPSQLVTIPFCSTCAVYGCYWVLLVELSVAGLI